MYSFASMVFRKKNLFGFLAVFGFLGLAFSLPSKAEAALPIGHVDGVSQSGVISGWVIDPDSAGRHIEVHAYFDGTAGRSKTVVGSSSAYARCDVRYLQDINDCGFHYGFDIQVPANLQDGREHKVYVYAIDANFANFGQGDWAKTGSSVLLRGSPKSFRIGTSNAPRHTRGALIQHNGTVYFVGNQTRYPFPNAEVFLSWGVRFDQVVPANSGDLALPVDQTVQHKTSVSSQIDATNLLPIGHVDGVTSEGKLRGWVFDPDETYSSISFQVYIDRQLGGFSDYSDITRTARPDVNSTFAIVGNHGFEVDLFSIPGISANTMHEAYVYAVDKNNGSVFLVNGSPYQFYLFSFPSEDSVFNRDAQRVSKVKQVMTALELYYNDMGKYPDGSFEIYPYGLDMTGWTSHPDNNGYISVVGRAPAADGTCGALNNEYYYQSPIPSSYYLTFCLGGSYGGYSKGVHNATPSGIQ